MQQKCHDRAICAVGVLNDSWTRCVEQSEKNSGLLRSKRNAPSPNCVRSRVGQNHTYVRIFSVSTYLKLGITVYTAICCVYTGMANPSHKVKVYSWVIATLVAHRVSLTLLFSSSLLKLQVASMIRHAVDQHTKAVGSIQLLKRGIGW